MLIVSKRCRDIAGDLSSLLYAPSVPPPLWRWWPYREGVEWVAGHNLPAGPLDALAALLASVASAPERRRRAKARGGHGPEPEFASWAAIWRSGFPEAFESRARNSRRRL